MEKLRTKPGPIQQNRKQKRQLPKVQFWKTLALHFSWMTSQRIWLFLTLLSHAPKPVLIFSDITWNLLWARQQGGIVEGHVLSPRVRIWPGLCKRHLQVFQLSRHPSITFIGTKLRNEHQHTKSSNIWQPWISQSHLVNPILKMLGSYLA